MGNGSNRLLLSEQLRHSLRELVEFDVGRIRLPVAEIGPVQKPESEGRVNLLEEHRNQNSTPPALGRFVSDPLGSDRNCRPQHDNALGLAQRFFYDLVEGFSQRDLSIPPNRPAMSAQRLCKD